MAHSKDSENTDRKAIGIDLGLKSFLTTSEGASIPAPQHYRALEEKLAVAQRANNKNRMRALHASIKNQRKDSQHKLSHALVKQYGAIFVGNVSASSLAKTNLAKSVYDAGWSQFVHQLQYKSDFAGVVFSEVNESYTTQTCSVCQSRTGPKGVEELHIRAWTCSVCQTAHSRDVNAAINIKQRGIVDALTKNPESQQKIRSSKRASAPGKVSGTLTGVNKVARCNSSQNCRASGVGHDPLAAGILAL